MTPHRHPYAGLTAFMATKHQKVPLVAPAFAARVGMTVLEARVDTDTLGTFSGEIPRPGTPWQTAVAKAHLGLDAVGGRLGLASEGSVGPHPSVPFLLAATELVVLVDRELDIVIGDMETSLELRTVSARVAPGEPLDAVMERGDLPHHALVVRPAEGPMSVVGKGLRDRAEVERWIREAAAVSPDGCAIVETDLRAHECPSRRSVIERAARRLAERVASCCPWCDTPGFGIVGVEPGAPCAECSSPTRLPSAHLWACTLCDVTERRPVLTPADPSQCPWCNP